MRELIGDGKTPLEILNLDIPAMDRLWVVLRPEIIPERELRLLACAFARTSLPLYERDYPEDARPRTAIETAERYARGSATREELAAAEAAAWAAAWAAAASAAEAAWAAARAAARAAASAAARAAARAAEAAAWAARDAEAAFIELTKACIDNIETGAH